MRNYLMVYRSEENEGTVLLLLVMTLCRESVALRDIQATRRKRDSERHYESCSDTNQENQRKLTRVKKSWFKSGVRQST